MNKEKAAEELYSLVCITFERGLADNPILARGGSKNQKNDVQFRLMKNIAKLKTKNDDSEELINTIMADVNIAHAMAQMTDETHQKIEKILGEL